MVTIAKMKSELLAGFSEPQAELMARVFVQAHDELVTKAEFNELTGVVRVLAEAQQRTEARVEELADAQRRTESRVEDLADAQRRTEARVEDLAEAQKELAEAQKELAEAQKQTEWAVRDLAKQVGGLSNALGGSLEDFACDLVPELLEKHWAMQVASAGPEDVTVGRKHREFDVVVRGTIAGRPVTVVCETKATVSAAEVEKFLALVAKLRAARPEEEIRPLFFGYRAERKARELIVKAGAAMVFTRGVMIPAA